MIITEKELELKELREEIASATINLVRLVGKRNDLARKVGRLKSSVGLTVEAEKVEDSLLRAVVAECERVGVSRRAGLKILGVLLSESKRIQGAGAGRSVESPMDSFATAVELERQGKKLIRLDVGEPDFEPPRAVLEACSKALFSFKTHYTLPRGIPELVSSLQNYLKRRFEYDAREEELIVTTGGRYAIYSAIASVVEEGDSAVVIDPNWPAYKQTLKHIGAKAIVVHTTLEDSWTPSIEEVEEAIRPNTTAIVLSYPNNPSGKIIDTSIFNALVDTANDHGLTVISDEAYVDYAYKRCPSVLHSDAKRFILARTFSKSWAMTGFRVGYAVGSEEIIRRMVSASSLMLTSVPEFVQYGAIKALESDAEAARNAATMKDRIEAACSALDGIVSLEYVRPDGGMYVFPQAKAYGFDCRSFADRLIAEKGVSVTPGTSFGDYLLAFRVSLVQPKETLTEGFQRIGAVLG